MGLLELNRYWGTKHDVEDNEEKADLEETEEEDQSK